MLNTNEAGLFKITFDWMQSVREFVAQDESRYVGARPVRSEVYIVAPSKSVAEVLLTDRMRWTSEDKTVHIRTTEEFPLYAVVFGDVRRHGILNTRVISAPDFGLTK